MIQTSFVSCDMVVKLRLFQRLLQYRLSGLDYSQTVVTLQWIIDNKLHKFP